MSPANDILTDALVSLRVRGSVLLNERYRSPWGVSVPDSRALSALLGAEPRTWPVAFHFVARGVCEIRSQSGQTISLTAGEMAICFSGQPHELGIGKGHAPMAIADLMAGDPNRYQAAPGQPGSCELVCGAFLLDDLRLNPLWASLPPVLHVRLDAGEARGDWVALTQLLSDELARADAASAYIVERLLEVLCAQAVRRHAAQAPPATPGWLAALRDPLVSRAMSLVHQSPGRHWSVEQLAAEVALSPSRFAARFSSTVGLSPMAYVTAWRMQQAVRWLADGQLSPSRVASALGYDSAASFSRAFKRHIGEAPSAVRQTYAAT